SGFVAERFWVAGMVVLAILGAQFLVAASTGWDTAVNSGILFAPVITVSVGASMLFFGRQREAEQRLGVAQDEITRLAVVEERARFSRDLHDIVTHHVTAMVVQADSAAYVDDESERAQTLASIGATGRRALQELRSL
ncbi:histidine kinase dimerization/phosphoacceptor domain-containing protein, partial [Bacillus sp. S34]|nr:histidine kinase dimerization/phosphoacceptor domain-containing protein [Bacillus sp. S34]